MFAVGLLTIGQSPRPDLSRPLCLLRPDLHLFEAGALDHLSASDLPTAAGAYPLKTRLRDGSLVTVDLELLEPLLQRALTRLEEQEVAATMLMCAGTFADLAGARPLLKPFGLVQRMLRCVGIHRIGVLCPYHDQVAAIRSRWLAADFDALVGAAALTDASAVERLVSDWARGPFPVECIVLDYVGHDAAQVAMLQQFCSVPVFDLGLTTMAVLAELIPEKKSAHR